MISCLLFVNADNVHPQLFFLKLTIAILQGMKLPHPSGLLARKVPASAITAANDQVNRVHSRIRPKQEPPKEHTRNLVLRRRLKLGKKLLNVEYLPLYSFILQSSLNPSKKALCGERCYKCR